MSFKRRFNSVMLQEKVKSTTSLVTCQKLFQILFPNDEFSSSKIPKLASAMKNLSEDIVKEYELGHPKTGGYSASILPVHVDVASLTGSQLVTEVCKRKVARQFDFSRYQKRYVALHVSYQGFDYHGFARQESIKNTIEEELFAAIRKTRLIPDGKSWKEILYSRGGRTDKGVSAAGQVVALEVRSKALIDEAPCSEDDELDYPGIINKVLSPKIRVLGWKTVDHSFSARFSAKRREYKYFFIDQDDELNLSAMQEAANFLIGEHDFRNFCKADIPTVTNFVRSILTASLTRTSLLQNFSAIELHITGTAFLWHQVCFYISIAQFTLFD